ncbi:MAG: adenosylcobinamide-GDP ribazoletransferase [Phyllobacterium sp.]
MRKPDDFKDDLLPTTMQALSFLSRLPVSNRWFGPGDHRVADTARAFPLAGLVIALPACLILLIATALKLPALIAGLLSVAALIIVTGALHEDGLSDVADGFYGGSTHERRLDIMKDSRIGTFGALSLIFSVVLRAALLAAIIERTSPFYGVLTIFGTEAASRAAMVWFWQTAPNVRPGGTADQAGTPDEAACHWALGFGLASLFVTYLLTGGIFGFLMPIILCAFAIAGFSVLCRDKIGGQTGDTLGAAQQIAALSLLAGLVITL